MANICSNTVTFIGDDKQLDKMMKCFEKTNEIRRNGNPGCHFVLFEPSTPVRNFMFDIMLDINGDGECIYFQTKWNPDPIQIVRIARMFQLSFELEYEELGDNQYGVFKYDYEFDVLTDQCLTALEIDMYRECGDPKNHPPKCNGEECDDYIHNYEKMHMHLEKKIPVRCDYDLKTGGYMESKGPVV